ncbi:MAG TPA: methylmalonyl-CoA mutase subunit beta [Pseudonocardiaceae bacterium]|jgi:methylmalonyl-CoA mutase|nr:methylmalonyl-CoA mutase subunit beta [Pseudonocardiaceae bacterium]
MTTPLGSLELAAEFPPASAARWQDLVRGVLAKSGYSADQLADAPESLLATTSYDGITIAPLYTAADRTGYTGLPGVAPFVRGSRPEGNISTGWDVRTRHVGGDPAQVNKAILTDLENGVASIWLTVEPDTDLPQLLDGVLLDLAPIVLDGDAADALLALHADRGIPDSAVIGNLGIDPIGNAARTGTPADLAAHAASAARYAQRYPRLRTMVVDALPYHEAGGSDAQELGASIATALAYLRALTDAGLTVEVAARQLEFRYAITADQFAGIAKLRAARRLWARVGEVLGVATAQRQHAVTSSVMLTRRDPWVNMLRGTIACFAAGVGGADAVTVAPFDAAVGADTGFSRRVARNTQAILLDESHVAGVIDPAGGSWYLESRTDELAHRAWDVFTEIERAGGIEAELASGALADRLAATWAQRVANIATRTDPITGVSEFPNLTEKPLDRTPRPAPPSGGLPVHRYAEDYEALRAKSDAVLAGTGARPTVFLATIGSVAAHTARAGFAGNLLQAGGIDTSSAGATIDEYQASGAKIACICGTDRAYADQAEPLAAALKSAGATKVLLAGPRNDAYPTVDEFLYRGCDALAVLHGVWDVLEAHS